jgi:Bacillus/Clostridium GerA spore germination protein.
MLIMMEFLIEASLRLPKTIGQTATTVGGLILGQAATQAHLVSNIMIIVVATVAISNFMIPTISMNLAVRVAKYGLLLLTVFTGIFGIYLGLYAIIMYTFSIYTYGLPFLDPIGNFSLEKIRSFIRKGK